MDQREARVHNGGTRKEVVTVVCRRYGGAGTRVLAGEGVRSRDLTGSMERESMGLVLLESQVAYLNNWVDGGSAVPGEGEIHLYLFSLKWNIGVKERKHLLSTFGKIYHFPFGPTWRNCLLIYCCLLLKKKKKSQFI